VTAKNYILIKNGLVVTERGSSHLDVLIEDSTVRAIGTALTQTGAKIIDAKNRYVLPGGVDVHTHMELPVMGIHSSDDFFTGTRAAICGGTTTIVDFANQVKGDTLINAYKTWRQKADSKVCCDYALHVSVTDVNTQTLTEIEELFVNAGVVSFKTFLAYESMKISLKELESLMVEVRKFKGLITNHAEMGDQIDVATANLIKESKMSIESHHLSHPVEAEVAAIKQLIVLAEKLKMPVYVVHLSSKEGLSEIQNAQRRGVKIVAETCPQYLCFSNEVYKNNFDEASKFVMSPPIRDRESSDHLWKGLIDGSIALVATDHCPFTIEQKRMGAKDFRKIPNGAPGVESRFELIFSEGVVKRQMSLERFVEVVATNPAKIFGLYPRKGAIRLGSDADIVIFNPTAKKILSSKKQSTQCDYSIYEGTEITGICEEVILKGRSVYKDGAFFGSRGVGRYLKRELPKLPNVSIK